jgi:hypothetical protein
MKSYDDDQPDYAELRAIPMWDVLDALEIHYSGPSPRGVKIHAIDRAERTPSLHVYEDHWYDFGSGKGGTPIDFVMAWYGCSFRRAVQWLSRLGGDAVEGLERTQHRAPERPVLDFARQVTAFPLALSHLADLRKRWEWLDSDTVIAWDLRVDKDRNLLIPYWSEGAVPAVKVRWGLTGDKGAWEGSRLDQCLYRPYDPGARSTVWLVEGESDAWRLNTHTRGRVAVAALPGVAQAHKEWPALAWADRVMVTMDNDPAGRGALAKLVDRWGDKARVCSPPAGVKDVCEIPEVAFGNWVQACLEKENV